MLALGMLPEAPARSFNLQPHDIKDRQVLILGAGLSGMAAAYELQKLGYKCTILEARSRAGGRCWSPKKGSLGLETGHKDQVAEFDDGLYFNAGPSRIPHHHQITMHYCRELGVPLEIYNNVNESAWYFAEGKGALSNKKIRAREIHNDMRGYMTELLAKAVDAEKVDTGLTKEDASKVIEYLRAEGGLDIDKLYKASARRGYIEAPGAGERAGTLGDPHKLADIIRSGLADPDFYNVAEYTYELQMTMFQAVGGMENIAKKFQEKVGNIIQFETEVTSIQNQAEGVIVIAKNAKGASEYKADYCICTIPLPVLTNVEHNFSGDVSRAIDFVTYNNTGKIGLQFRRRFWEMDEQIYGGITHTNNQLTQIFYPSNGYHSQKGILIGYYNFNEKAKAIGELAHADREKLALEKGSLIHPQYKEEFEQSFSVSWHKTKYNLGGWAVYNSKERQSVYKALLKPEKQVYFAGEHTTYLNSWMAGAFESARHTVAAIHARAGQQAVQYSSQGISNS